MSGALAEIQGLASEFSQTSTARQHGLAVWVAFVADATYPWRLVEIERSTSGRRRRTRILCFRLLDEIRRAAGERLAWATADERFRATHMTTPGGLPGVTGDWVHSKDFDSMFATSRRSLRNDICATTPARTVELG